MRSKERDGRLVEDHLHQPLILAERDSLAVSDEWKSADANFDVFLFRRLLGQSDRGNLWRAIGAARNEALVHGTRVQALDCLDRDNPLMFGLVREQRRTGNVPDGIDAGHVGTVEWINDDRATLDFVTHLFQDRIFTLDHDTT